MINFRKLFCFSLIFLFVCVFAHSKELEGKDLEIFTTVVNSKLYVENFEELSDKLKYLDGIEKDLVNVESALSDEAKLICHGIIILQRETVKNNPGVGISSEPQNKKKDKKDPKAKETEKILMDLFNSYDEFAKAHENLSSVFYLRYKEAEFATLAYLSTSQQLKILKNILGDYQKIEEMNPNYSENLINLGMSLYFVPAILGGNKKDAEEKLRIAVRTAANDYEKVNANLILSQLLLEDKKTDESKKFFEAAWSIAPNSKTIKELKEMNDAGYSIFQADKYKKK